MLRTGILLSLLLPLAAAAQVPADTYKAFKKGNDGIMEAMTVTVAPLGNGVMHFNEGNPRQPLDGYFQIAESGHRFTQGNIKHGIANGAWEYHSGNGTIVKTAPYRNGRLDGEVVIYYDNGAQERVATYNHGIRTHNRSYYSGGELKAEEFYDDEGSLHGESWGYDAAGNVITEKRYEHGLRQGVQVETDDEGCKISQEYVAGKCNGAYNKLYSDGTIAQKGSYDQDGLKTGHWEQWNAQGVLTEEATYAKDQYEGEHNVYFSNGKLKLSEQYRAGKLDGDATEFEEEPYRMVRKVKYADGRLHGAFKIFHDGILWREGSYKEGKLVYEKEFAKGKLQIVKLLDENGSLIPVERYDETGKQIYKNRDYRKPSDIVLKESAAGVVEVEVD